MPWSYGCPERTVERDRQLIFQLSPVAWRKYLSMAQAALWLLQGISRTEVARRLRLNPDNLSRDFKKVYHRTITEFFDCLRGPGALWPNLASSVPCRNLIVPVSENDSCLGHRPIEIQPREPDFHLTNREQQFKDLLAKGRWNKEMADVLKIAESTVKNELRLFFAKLKVRSRAEAIIKLFHLK